MFCDKNEAFRVAWKSRGHAPQVERLINLVVMGELMAYRIAHNEIRTSKTEGRNQMAGLSQLIAGAAAANLDEPSARTLLRLGAVGVVGTPLILDVSGDGSPGVLSADAHTVEFDLDGDGGRERIAWLSEAGGDALFARDRGGDGQITSGRELFGWADGHRDGFQALAADCDKDGDGWIRGRELAGLVLWRDDGDRVSQPSELTPVSEAGIEAIACRHRAMRSMFVMRGEQRAMWDWMPEIRPVFVP